MAGGFLRDHACQVVAPGGTCVSLWTISMGQSVEVCDLFMDLFTNYGFIIYTQVRMTKSLYMYMYTGYP